jgi:hypothetical protein
MNRSRASTCLTIAGAFYDREAQVKRAHALLPPRLLDDRAWVAARALLQRRAVRRKLGARVGARQPLVRQHVLHAVDGAHVVGLASSSLGRRASTRGRRTPRSGTTQRGNLPISESWHRRHDRKSTVTALGKCCGCSAKKTAFFSQSTGTTVVALGSANDGGSAMSTRPSMTTVVAPVSHATYAGSSTTCGSAPHVKRGIFCCDARRSGALKVVARARARVTADVSWRAAQCRRPSRRGVGARLPPA